MFDAVSLYHTVSRAGKRYFSASYESVLILTILHHLVLEGVKFRMLVAGHGLQVIIESWLHFLAAFFVDFSRGKLLPVKLWYVCCYIETSRFLVLQISIFLRIFWKVQILETILEI